MQSNKNPTEKPTVLIQQQTGQKRSGVHVIADVTGQMNVRPMPVPMVVMMVLVIVVVIRLIRLLVLLLLLLLSNSL